MVDVERCVECGFDGSEWTDADAISAIGELPGRWADAIDGVGEADLLHRPLGDMWSIGEYVDHVREVLFGMRFLIDIAVENPGTDLGDPPEPACSATPARIDVPDALERLGREAAQLRDRLDALTADEWSATVRFDGADHDVHWIARHAVHDATHHVMDVGRLRASLDR